MASPAARTRVLITVMTYPHPSKKSQEVVCTAGITEQLEWVRLYPINYRYRPEDQRFRKYQWVEVDLAPKGSGNDSRLESRKPHIETMALGEYIPSSNGWRARRAIIDKMPVHTVNQLRELYEREKRSLGIVKPTEVLGINVVHAERKWKPEWQQVLRQLDLFHDRPKQLEKIPFSFSYVFRCEDGQHTAQITDWELGVLFLNERKRLSSESEAAESVRTKYLTQMCSSERDAKFFMGTTLPYNSWIVLGVFWPPRQSQMDLFDG